MTTALNDSSVTQGNSQRGAMPPNRRLSGFFTEKNWLCWDIGPAVLVFCGPQICQKCVGGQGSAPDPAGSSRRSPRPISRLGRKTPPPQFPPLSAPQFSHLWRSASVPLPHNVKSWLCRQVSANIFRWQLKTYSTVMTTIQHHCGISALGRHLQMFSLTYLLLERAIIQN